MHVFLQGWEITGICKQCTADYFAGELKCLCPVVKSTFTPHVGSSMVAAVILAFIHGTAALWGEEGVTAKLLKGLQAWSMEHFQNPHTAFFEPLKFRC